MYELTCQRAALEPPTPQMTRLITALHGNQHDTDQFIGVIAGTVPIPEFFAPGNIQRIIDTSRKPAAHGHQAAGQFHFTVAASDRCRPAAIVIASSIPSSRAGPHRLGEKKHCHAALLPMR